MSISNEDVDRYLDSNVMSVDELFNILKGDRETRACWLCRFWQEERDDQRQPRWGTCLRPAAQPPPLAFPVAEDPTYGCRLMTHPKFYCSEWDGE